MDGQTESSTDRQQQGRASKESSGPRGGGWSLPGLRGRMFHVPWLVSIPQHRPAPRLSLIPGLQGEGICDSEDVGDWDTYS